MTVSVLLEQSSNKSKGTIKLDTSCYQLVQNLFQQLGTSSAKTTCEQLVNTLVAGLLQLVCVVVGGRGGDCYWVTAMLSNGVKLR